MSSHRNRHRLSQWAFRSFVVCAVLLALSPVGNGAAEARDKPKKREVPAVNVLTIELILPKDHRYKLSDNMDVEILFRNTSQEEVTIAISERESISLFFAFLIVGDRGESHIAQPVAGGGWNEPSKKYVKLVSIRPGATYRARVKEAIRLDKYQFAANERYSVLAIYRDYLSSHLQNDPNLWKGVMTSPAIPLNLVFPPQQKN